MLKIIEIVAKGKMYIDIIQSFLVKVEEYIPAGTQISFLNKTIDAINKIQEVLDIVEKYLAYIPSGLSEEDLPEDLKAAIKKFEEEQGELFC